MTYVVYLAVRPQVTALSELLAADVAVVGPFSRMAANMDLEGARAHERLLAHWALERSLASVSTEVVREMPMSGERSSTALESAHEGLLSVVDTHVGLQIAFLREPLVATLNGTNEGLEPSLHRFIIKSK